jgi:hypothetical protein
MYQGKSFDQSNLRRSFVEAPLINNTQSVTNNTHLLYFSLISFLSRFSRVYFTHCSRRKNPHEKEVRAREMLNSFLGSDRGHCIHCCGQ